MLTVAKVTSQIAAGYADYLEGKARPSELGDYYLKDGERVEAPGRWVAGAELVGANRQRRCGGEQLRALMAVRRPDTGEPLRPVGGDRRGRRGDRRDVLGAEVGQRGRGRSATRSCALGSRRRTSGRSTGPCATRSARCAMVRETGRPRRPSFTLRPADLIATSWRHTTARAVDDRPPDPQLHSHVLLHAAVRQRRAGRGDRLALLVVAPPRGRRRLPHRARARARRRLGFEIQRGTGRGGRYFEIDGVPQALLDRWSSRHQQVHAVIERYLADKRRGGQPARSTPAEERLAAVDQPRRQAAGHDRRPGPQLACRTRATRASTPRAIGRLQTVRPLAPAASRPRRAGRGVDGVRRDVRRSRGAGGRAGALGRRADRAGARTSSTEARAEREVLGLQDGRSTTRRIVAPNARSLTPPDTSATSSAHRPIAPAAVADARAQVNRAARPARWRAVRRAAARADRWLPATRGW